MKVFDIITESRLPLTEQMWRFGQMLTYAVERGGVGIEHALTWLAKAVARKPNAATELAEAWILTAEKAGMSSAEAISLGSKAARESGIADDVILAAEKEASRLAAKQANSIWGQLKTPESKSNFYYGATASVVNKGLTYWMVGKPVYDCIQGILQVYRMRDEGHPELQDKDKLQWAVQWYIDRGVQQIMAALVGGAVLKKVLGSWVPGVAYNVPIFGKLVQKLDPIYSKLPPAGQAYFKYWITTEAGQEAVAKWIAGELLIPGTDWKIPGGPTLRGMVADPISGIIKSGYDFILRQMGSDKAQQLPPPDPNADKPTSQRRYDLGTGRALDKPAY